MSSDLFLAKLKDLGGSASTSALRKELGWEPELFKDTEEAALESGFIVKITGTRSVMLAERAPLEIPGLEKPVPAPKVKKEKHVAVPGEVADEEPAAYGSQRSGAVKKSDLYSSLWQGCDALRGSMDASQYKDYVLVLLFLKYISDKYAGQPYAPIAIPDGSSFADMSALKGSKEIGESINKKIIAPLVAANSQLSLSDFPDFDDEVKLGKDKEKVDLLTNLIAIFEKPELNFSQNRADGDDILGDAYEYLMRHFASESGKSKGQFYTPAEVSRILAQILGLKQAKTSASTTVYDPTCGSGSLLLKVAEEAHRNCTLYGQEKDSTTSGLARMNMILHDMPTALIAQGNTLASPAFKDGEGLKTFDYVVANPPFSDKRWSQGVSTGKDDPFKRFEDFGTPPDKQGDYAYLLHIVRSLKSNGKGACILPHGVLFRGNAEAEIRTNLIRRGYIKSIIGLPANLFYGTGIPACILLLDKEGAEHRKGIFMVDASQGFIKDGPKNRLRARDIHKIVDAVTRQAELPKFSRLVPRSEIEKNDFNLNLPRYIDSQEAEDLQDIEGHLKGGIPTRDVEALARYWQVCPGLKAGLFQPLRPGYLSLVPAKSAIKSSIFGDPEFSAFTTKMNAHFATWSATAAKRLKALQPGFHPKELIAELAESLLQHYEGLALMDPYAVYQHLLDYWEETMQDDAYLITEGGWKAETYRVIETKKGKDGKPGKQVDKGWACDLVPKAILVSRFYAAEQAALNTLEAEAEALAAQLSELEEGSSGEAEAFDLDKVNKAEVSKALKDAATETEHRALLRQWLDLAEQEAQVKRKFKDADEALDRLAYRYYPKLDTAAIQSLVVDDKWLPALASRIGGEVDRINQGLTQRVKELAERYEAPLPQMSQRVSELEAKVNAHLKRMGFEA